MELTSLNSFLLFLCFSASIYTTTSFVSGLNSDGFTLLALLRHWTSVPPSINSSWNASDSTPCKWVGVKCDTDHFVLSLNLSGLGISGQLGPEIAHLHRLQNLDLSYNSFYRLPSHSLNFTALEYLDMSMNNLNGNLPEWLFQIPHLQSLFLSSNSFNGSIPSNVGNMSEIVDLWLNENHLSGPIPSSIGNCGKLQQLILNKNNLVGILPESLNNLENLENLVYLYVSDNSLEGSIPLGSGSCKNLQTLVLSYNAFSGDIPPGLGNCSRLTNFAAADNGLSGSIPSSFGLLDKLSILYLPENHLSGKIPPELGRCKSLTALHLYSNQLEGEIPTELGMLSELQDLELFSNYLIGEIPNSIWKIPSLEYLLVYNNNLSGELPPEMAELKQLKNISLYNNQFFGVIPQSLGINSSLLQLDFTNNNFTGNIPPNLCFGKQLSVLNMGLNQLQGSIPPDVGSCSTLWRLILKRNKLSGALPEFTRNPNLLFMDISENNISGAIPSSLGNCTSLASINLSRNKLTGLIPQELGNLVDLQTLILSYNDLEGPLPSQLSNCNKLNLFDAGFNSLNGSIPSSLRNWTSLSTLILSGNRFTGGIPSFLSAYEKLSDLQIGGNLLGGTIPSSIGSLQNLFYVLNLSDNGLTGQVPLELRKLSRLQRLDISLNDLNGSLAALDEIQSLIEVNISYNMFSGPIPKTLMKLLNSSPSSFVGNPSLCISCLPSGGLTCVEKSNFKPCDRESSNRKGLRKEEIAMIAVGSSLVTIFVLLGLICLLLWRRRQKQDVEKPTHEGSSPLLNKVMEATQSLNETYIIGRGAHGTVYKAVLAPDKVFAVKKLVFAGNKGGNVSMTREIQTVGKVRHRNLVRLEDFWLRKDYGLLLYRYMQNGSLHDILHGISPPQTLDWSKRYKIAVGTAHGLAYLHYDCDPAIVHRDIKPNNILLDNEMEPHISDFGIAKLLDQSSASMPSSTVVGTFGYIAPENAFTTKQSKESDVYSYGVVLLELISRKKALESSFEEGTDIVGWVRSVWSNTEDINRIVDLSLIDELSDSNVMEHVVDVLFVALRCTEKEPSKRPTMRDVVNQLLDANATLMRNKYDMAF